MREVQLPQRLDAGSGGPPGRGRGPLADAVEAQHGRPLERARVEGGGRVRQVVLAEEERRQRALPGQGAELAAQL